MLTPLRIHWLTSRPVASRALRGGVLAAALLAIVLIVSFRACAPSSVATQQHINRPASGFTLPAEQSGIQLSSPVTYTATPGKPTLLAFFYTLCTHCLLQMQTAQNVASQFAGLRSVYIDSPAERPNIPDMMMRRLGIGDPVLLDTNSQVAARYGIAYYPALVLIDRRGIVRDIWTGEVDAATLRVGIAQALSRDGGN